MLILHAIVETRMHDYYPSLYDHGTKADVLVVKLKRWNDVFFPL